MYLEESPLHSPVVILDDNLQEDSALISHVTSHASSHSVHGRRNLALPGDRYLQDWSCSLYWGHLIEVQSSVWFSICIRLFIRHSHARE